MQPRIAGDTNLQLSTFRNAPQIYSPNHTAQTNQGLTRPSSTTSGRFHPHDVSAREISLVRLRNLNKSAVVPLLFPGKPTSRCRKQNSRSMSQALNRTTHPHLALPILLITSRSARISAFACSRVFVRVIR